VEVSETALTVVELKVQVGLVVGRIEVDRVTFPVNRLKLVRKTVDEALDPAATERAGGSAVSPKSGDVLVLKIAIGSTSRTGLVIGGSTMLIQSGGVLVKPWQPVWKPMSVPVVFAVTL
jgi:hypothetical protein